MSSKDTNRISHFGLNTAYVDSAVITQEMREELGGKGAGLAVMSNMGFNIPPGVTVSTSASQEFSNLECVESYFKKEFDYIMNLAKEVNGNLSEVEEHFGYKPLFAVRSGASVSMPGMMDTVLNVGINRNNIDEWSNRIGEKSAWDCYARLLMTIATSVFEVDDKTIHEIEESVYKFKYGLKESPESYADFTSKHFQKFASKLEKYLDKKASAYLKNFFSHISGVKDITFTEFINGDKAFRNQLCLTTFAVLASWNSNRAIKYREINNLQHVKGTAINIQAMVFGNFNNMSCSGVLFTRNPTTGENEMTGEYLVNAQGEDVVSGYRTPKNIEEMRTEMPAVYEKLVAESRRMESNFQDMMDIEFTVQDGELFFLQTRAGKRSTQAKIVIAFDMYEKGILDNSELKNRVSAKDLEKLATPSISSDTIDSNISIGIPASGGVVKGVACFTSRDAVKAKADGKSPILFAFTTTPDDIEGIDASVGIVTEVGGVTSHAAVVARGMDKSCIVGVSDMDHQADRAYFDLSDTFIKDGDDVVIDGSTGKIYSAETVKVEKGKISPLVAEKLLKNIRNKNGFYLNINDIYIDSLDLKNIQDKLYIRVKPQHMKENLIEMIDAVADKIGRQKLVLDISALERKDFVENSLVSSMLQTKGVRSYSKQNLLKFSRYMDKFSKQASKKSNITVVSNGKKINYNIDPNRTKDTVDIDVKASTPIGDIDHFESAIFS